MIRLVALDLDQTLFGPDLIISQRVRDTVRRVVEGGVWVTLATGREAKLAARFAGELGLSTPVIAAQGGCIYDHLSDRVLHDVRLPAEVLPYILEGAKRYAWHIHFEMFDRLFFPAHSNHPEALFELLRYSNWARVGNLLTDMPEPPHKLIVTLDDPADRGRVLAELKGVMGGRMSFVASHPHLVEGLPPGVGKHHGLAWLAGNLGLGAAAVMAVGDSDADVPMLRWAGVGVAMGNAPPSVQAVATWVAPSVEEDGVAAALDRFVPSRG